MVGCIAAVIFAVAFVISATSTSTGALFAPAAFVAAGLACLAPHLWDVGKSWSVPRGRRR